MKSLRPLLVLGGALAVLALLLSTLFQRRVARDLFPEYSTLRADPLGTRALHDAVAAVPEMQVERWVRPLDRLPEMPPRTLVLAGADATQWEKIESRTFNTLENAVRAGARLVLAFRAEDAETIARRGEWERFVGELREARKRGQPVDESRRNPARRRPAPPRPERAPAPDQPVNPELKPVSLSQLWGFEFSHRDPGADEVHAQRTASAPAVLPAAVRWQSARHFAVNAAQGWRVLYRRGEDNVLVELPLGRGSIVLASDSYFLSNEAVQRDRSTALLSWILGPHRQVVFVETHLGVTEDPGVAALARRYGLAPAAGAALLLALLFIWRRLALFVPPETEPPVTALRYQPAAGLAALLRRSLPVANLVPTAFTEWRKTARATELTRTVNVALVPGDPPVNAYNRIAALLRRK